VCAGTAAGLLGIGIGARGRISGGFMRGRSFGAGVGAAPAALLLFSFFLIMCMLLLNFYFTFI
jgi:hypothetical protein